MEFVFCTKTPLSEIYKKSLVRRLLKSKGLPFSAVREGRVVCLIGDWTLWRGDDKDTSPQYILSRDTVKSLLGVKKLKAW